MSGPVLSLVPNGALAMDRQQLAAKLRKFADDVEAGEHGDVERVLVVVESADCVDRHTFGRPMSEMELVGLLEWSKFNIMFGAASE